MAGRITSETAQLIANADRTAFQSILQMTHMGKIKPRRSLIAERETVCGRGLHLLV